MVAHAHHAETQAALNVLRDKSRRSKDNRLHAVRMWVRCRHSVGMVRQCLEFHGFKKDDGRKDWTDDDVKQLLQQHDLEVNANELAEELGRLRNPARGIKT